MRASARGRSESPTEVAARPRDVSSIELPPNKLVEAKDLYRIPLWIGRKTLFTLAPVPLLFRLARARAAVRWFVPRRRRRAVARMERFYGETKSHAEVRHIARRHLEYAERRDLARLWPYIQGFAGHESCQVEGLQHLDDALAGGKGVILATMHFGYARLIKPLLEPRGYRAWVVGKTGQSIPARFTRVGLLVHSRLLGLPRGGPPELADLQAGINLRPILAALSRNEILIIPVDNPGVHAKGRAGSARPIPVLGRNVLFAPGAISMARATGAAVLPTFVVDSEDGDAIGIRLAICPPLDIERSESRNEDKDTSLERYAAVFEEYLRRYPHQFRGDGPGTAESLRVGDPVTVRGRRDDDGSFVAFTVKIRPSKRSARIRGPIEEIDEQRELIRVLGRDAHVAAGCEVIDRAGKPISLRDLSVAEVVEVTGTCSGSGSLVGSSIRVSHRPHLQELQGTVESVSADRRTFEVLGFRVTTTELTMIKDRTEGRPMTGRRKDRRAARYAASRSVEAGHRRRARSSIAPPGGLTGEGQMPGREATLPSAPTARAEGPGVRRGATSPPGGVANLETGMRVMVKGRARGDGSFVALMVRVKRPGVRAEIKAAVESVDPDLGVVRVLHRDIAFSSSCQMTDRSGRPFSARQIAAGDVVRLTGTYSTEEGFAAGSIRVSRSGDVEEIVGNIESFDRDRRSFDVLGFSVFLTDNTEVMPRSRDLTVGDPAHPIELPKLDLTADGRATAGEIVQIPDGTRRQPTVLLFGSYTCPLSRRLIAAVAELYECFQDRLAFFFVYTREAHPEGGPVSRENKELGIAVRASTSDAERTLVAGRCARHLGVRMPVLIDTVENSVADLYGAWPARLYLIGADGRIAHAGGSGPVGDDAEMMRVRIKSELDQLQAAIERELAGQVR